MSEIILGIDPGTRITGYAVIKKEDRAIEILDCGCIKPPVDLDLAERYFIIFNGVDQLISKHKAKTVSVETQFVSKNIQSASKLWMARGAVLIAAAKNGIKVHEYAPRKAKLAIVGNGAASKEQVQRMLQAILKLPQLPEPQDVADALALAICHANQRSSCMSFSAER